MFKKAKQNRVFQDVVEQIEDAILNRQLEPGSKLPPERTLKDMFNTSRGTLREALWDAKYEERSEDGQRYYHESQRSLYISFVEGTYTFSEVKTYENYTSNLADEIFKGNWLTAQDTCTNLPTSGIFEEVNYPKKSTLISCEINVLFSGFSSPVRTLKNEFRNIGTSEQAEIAP